MGEAFGKVTPGLVAGSGRAGRETDGSTPGGRVPGGNMPGGKVTPTPAGVGLLVVGAGVGVLVVGVGVLVVGAGVLVVGVGVGLPPTAMLSHPVAGDAASGEVPVAVRVRLAPAACFGTTTIASNSTAWPVGTATRQVAVPGCAQTVKVGEVLPG